MSNQSTFTYDVAPKAEYIRLTMSGLASAYDIKAAYGEVFSLALENDQKCLLVDLRQLTLDYQASEIVHVMKAICEQLKHYRVARVVDHNNHKQLLIKQIADNHQLTMENFVDLQQAEIWLSQ